MSKTKASERVETTLSAWLAAHQTETEQRAALDSSEPTAEALTALQEATGKTAAAAKEYREALDALKTEKETADADLDPDKAELREAQRKYNPALVAKAFGGRGRLDGLEAEVNQEFGCDANQIPISVFDAAAQGTEKRAITPAPSGAENVWGISPALFSRGVGPYLGVDMPAARSGAHSELVITTSVTASGRSVGEASVATAGALAARVVSAKRLSASLQIAAESLATVGAAEQFNAAMRENLSLAVNAALDTALLNDTSDTDVPKGLLGNSLLPEPSASVPATQAPGFGDWYGELVAKGADGKWSMNRRDRRLLVNESTFEVMGGMWRNNDSNMDLAEIIAAQMGGIRVSEYMPARDATKKASAALAIRAGMGAVPTPMRVAAMPVWDRIEIEDRFTDSAAAIVNYHVHILVGDLILLRPEAYIRYLLREQA